MGKFIVGQSEVIEQLMIAVLAGGHCLLEGVPGLAKTAMIRTLSQTLAMSFRRIQFTPDLMPSDITGTDIIQEDPETGRRSFVFQRGPVFTQMLLADEINRTPPKTQAALLEAMQEKTVTVGGHTLPLDEPFFVLATQNPIEQEGTYPLPEAQRDRFIFLVKVDYPSREEERQIVARTTGTFEVKIEPVLSGAQILDLPENRAQGPGAGPRHGFHPRPGALHASERARARRRLSRSSSHGAPARAPARTWCSAAKSAPCCAGASM